MINLNEFKYKLMEYIKNYIFPLYSPECLLYIYKIYCIKCDSYNVRHTSPLFDTKVHIDIV